MPHDLSFDYLYKAISFWDKLMAAFIPARCPVGTYYDSSADDCLLCPEGTYSPNEGALQCTKCPEGTWTIGTRQENFTACTGDYLVAGLKKNFVFNKNKNFISTTDDQCSFLPISSLFKTMGGFSCCDYSPSPVEDYLIMCLFRALNIHDSKKKKRRNTIFKADC